jgi:hypothetical protein
MVAGGGAQRSLAARPAWRCIRRRIHARCSDVGTAVKVRHPHERHDGDGLDGRGWAWWWAARMVGMTRRRGVGRLPARLMYAGWDRRSAVRRKVPLTRAPAK